MKSLPPAKKAKKTVAAPAEEDPVDDGVEEEEMDAELREQLEAQQRQEESDRMRKAANDLQAGYNRVLAAFERGRMAAKDDTLHFMTMAVGCRERSAAARNTQASFVVPSNIRQFVNVPTYSSQQGKSCYTTVVDDALSLPTFVSEQNAKRGTVVSDVKMAPGSFVTIGTPDLPGNFPMGVPMMIFDVRGTSYIKQAEAAPAPAPAAAGASVVVTFGPGSVIETAEKPKQYDTMSSPSGLKNIDLVTGEPLCNLRFGEALIAWSRFAYTRAFTTPTEPPQNEASNNIVIIPTGPNIQSIVEDLCGITVLPAIAQDFQGDAGKGIHGDTCGLSRQLDPERKLKQAAFMRLYQMPNGVRHQMTLEQNAEDPSIIPEPIGMTISARGYSDFVAAYAIDPLALNQTRWTQGIVPYIPLADGFFIGMRNWEATVEGARKLQGCSTVKDFDISMFDEEPSHAEGGSEDPVSLSKMMQPSVATLMMPLQNWRSLILGSGIRLNPAGAAALYKTLGTDAPTELVTDARTPLPNKRLVSTFVPNGIYPLWLHMGPNDPGRRWLPIEETRNATVKGVQKTLTVWSAPKHAAFRVEYYALSPTLARVPNRARYAERVNSAKPTDSGARFLDALLHGSVVKGDEPIYQSNAEIGAAVRDLRKDGVVPIDTGSNMLLFAVLIDNDDSENPQWPDIKAVRPEVMAILDAINGPLPISDAMAEFMKSMPDAKMLNSHGSDLGRRIGLGKTKHPGASAASSKKPAEPLAKRRKPEPEPVAPSAKKRKSEPEVEEAEPPAKKSKHEPEPEAEDEVEEAEAEAEVDDGAEEPGEGEVEEGEDAEMEEEQDGEAVDDE
jgi:hypothetical protein